MANPWFDKNTFRPKIIDALQNYNRKQFSKDLMAGIIVGIVALPLAIAFAIASGVTPQQGLFTAVIAGFIISALGGSRVQIGGPTGAFIIIVYGIVQQYGTNGLIIATFLAGIMLIIMGIAQLGSVIKFIPHPLIIGFTSGIALLIFSSQVKDFFGLKMDAVPADFIEKWASYATHFSSFNWLPAVLALGTVVIIQLWPRVSHKIPGSLIAILVTTAIVQIWKLPVETIGSRFGEIPNHFPKPSIPDLDFATIQRLFQPAFTIALLGGIESLLSAVVADGMIGGRHRSNMELVAQGTANIFSGLFGGIPATGAIARTATNVKNGGRTPVAGIIHAITLLLIMLFIGKWAALIPMATLAGILVVVAYHMSEWQTFRAVLKGPKTDVIILLTTFFLTVIIDLTVAIEVGMILAAFLFLRNMIKASEVNSLTRDPDAGQSPEMDWKQVYQIPEKVEVFEIAGPLFFGAAYKFKDAIQFIETTPKVLIIRMGMVPVIDATGIKTIADVHHSVKQLGCKLILSEVRHPKVFAELQKARLIFAVGKANVTETFESAVSRARQILADQSHEA